VVSSQSGSGRGLHDSDARTLVAGDLDAVFHPGRGMLCASLRHRGTEFLRRVDDLEAAAAAGSTAGIPFLYPWANRLAGFKYRTAGRSVTLDRSSTLLHFDPNGLPIHGVPWSKLIWEVGNEGRERLTARLEWARNDLLAVFPFRHRVEMAASLGEDGLTIETKVIAGDDGPVPVSFGFHPYFGLPESARANWRLVLPPMRRLELDPNGIPTGGQSPFDGFDAPLGGHDFDTGFMLSDQRTALSVGEGGYRISVEFLGGYPYAQVYAPQHEDYVALEPMTAPTNALVSGNGLRLVEPGAEFRAAFRIRIVAS
jgi:aldose 1-epimerase